MALSRLNLSSPPPYALLAKAKEAQTIVKMCSNSPGIGIYQPHGSGALGRYTGYLPTQPIRFSEGGDQL